MAQGVGLEIRVQVSVFRDEDVASKFQDLGTRMRVLGFGLRVAELGLRIEV